MSNKEFLPITTSEKKEKRNNPSAPPTLRNSIKALLLLAAAGISTGCQYFVGGKTTGRVENGRAGFCVTPPKTNTLSSEEIQQRVTSRMQELQRTWCIDDSSIQTNGNCFTCTAKPGIKAEFR